VLGEERCLKLKELIFLENFSYNSWDSLAYNEDERNLLHAIRNALVYIHERKKVTPFIKKLLMEAIEELKKEEHCDVAEILGNLLNEFSED